MAILAPRSAQASRTRKYWRVRLGGNTTDTCLERLAQPRLVPGRADDLKESQPRS